MEMKIDTNILHELLLTFSIFCCYCSNNSNVCLSSGCIKAAAKILSNMDSKIDPCHDFYQFACGNFKEKNGLHESVDAIKLEALRHNKELKDLINEISFSNDTEMETLKIFHFSCMNANLDDFSQLNSVLTILKKIADWPLINDCFDEDSFDWVEYNEKLINVGALSSAIIHLGTNAGDDSPSFSVKAFKISISSLWVDYSSFINATLQLSSKSAANSIIHNAFANISNELLLNVTLLAQELQQTNSCKNGFEDKTITILDLYNITDRIDWLEFINKQYFPYTATVNDSVRIDYCSYLILPDVIPILDKTSPRIVATFMLLKTTVALLSELDYYHTPYKHAHTQKLARAKKCMQTELIYFPIQIFKLYTDKYIVGKTESEVSFIMLYVHAHLLRSVSNADWLSSGTRRRLEDAVKAVRSHLFLGEKYQEITATVDKMINLTSDDFLSNLLQLSRAKFTLHIHKMYRMRKDYLFHMALYRYNIKSLSAHLYINYIGVSPSLFKGNFFALDRPMSMNYGSLGFIFGHELIHSVNKYFLELKSIARRDITAYNLFHKKVNCFTEKLKNYVVTDLKIQHRGNISLNEDLSDIEGARLSYKAFNRWNRNWNKKIDQKLPGQNFTLKQLFWLQLANTFCRFDNALHWQGMRNDSHSHNKFRIWGMVSNSIDFAKDFNCPNNSPMNPKEKCRLWMY